MADDVAETRRLLGDSVAGFVAANPGPTRIRRLRGTRPGVDRTVWRAMAEGSGADWRQSPWRPRWPPQWRC